LSRATICSGHGLDLQFRMGSNGKATLFFFLCDNLEPGLQDFFSMVKGVILDSRARHHFCLKPPRVLPSQMTCNIAPTHFLFLANTSPCLRAGDDRKFPRTIGLAVLNTHMASFFFSCSHFGSQGYKLTNNPQFIPLSSALAIALYSPLFPPLPTSSSCLPG